MKVKIVAMVFLLLTSGLLVALPGVQVYGHTEADPYITDLIADGGSADTAVDIGDVLVWNDEDYLYVKYVTVGWYMTEVHLHVATGSADIPQKNGNPIPGKFEYGDEDLWTMVYEFDPIELSWDPGTQLYIAAHAVAWEEASLTSMAVVSAPDVTVYGPSSSYLPLGDAGWGLPGSAVATWVHGSWPSISGATWISTAYYVEDPVLDSWRWFSHGFEVPGYPASGSISVAATSDNAEEVYFNGGFVDSDGEVQGPFVDDHEWNTVLNYAISPQMGSNTLDFIVRNYAQAGGTATSNPTGLIYKACVCYYAREETAWGDGCDFDGRNWATYFTYTVQGWNVEGDWIIRVYYGTTYDHDFTFSAVQTGGAFTGTGGYPATGPPYSVTEDVTGTVSGNTITFHSEYQGSTYYWDAVGTIASDGTMSGTWTSSTGQAGNWESISGQAVWE